METNENTIRMEGQEENLLKEQTQSETQGTRDDGLWKKVSFGTAAGILLGAGTIYAVDHIGGEELTIEQLNIPSSNSGPQPPIYNHAPVAHVSDNMSFGQAFAAARAQVGAGGVFSWHGGIYGTYYENEWNAMSPAQRAAYAHSVNPEVRAHHVDTTHVNEHHPDVAVNTNTRTTRGQQNRGEGQQQNEHDTNRNGHDNNNRNGNDNNNRNEHNNNHNDDNNHDHNHNNGGGGQTQGGHFLEDDEDVHVIARSRVQGHEAVAVDVTGNNQPDAVIIDVDDNHVLSKPDVVILRDGRQGTVGEFAQARGGSGMDTDAAEADSTGGADSASEDTHNNNNATEDPSATQASYENPDVAPDMPDYMDDANIMV